MINKIKKNWGDIVLTKITFLNSFALVWVSEWMAREGNVYVTIWSWTASAGFGVLAMIMLGCLIDQLGK